ncbi:MAG: hypothetical protein H6752_18535, partial [Candidatus Omnitrophica bacterium]|nr:hypothetical protein [Candidatus Omnitrophota bacterium]
MQRIILTLCLIVTLPTLALAQTGERPVPENLIEINNDLSMAFETPHTKWAKPYALGSIRILFMAPWYQGSTDGREMIELMQRFDLDAYAFHILGGNTLAGDGDPRWYKDPEAGTKRFNRLTEEPFDVFFINRVEFDSLPDHVKSKIEEQVKNGSGLVISGEVKLPAFVTGEGEAVSDDPRDGTLYSIGEGRVIQLPEREQLEFDLGWEIKLDYQMARQGRAILRAANREPRASLDVEILRAANRELGVSPGDPPPTSPIPRKESGLLFSRTTCRNAPEGTEIHLNLRTAEGERKLYGDIRIGEEGQMWDHGLGILSEGEYFVDVIARSDKGVENWATASFEVVSDRRVASVGLKKDWAEVGEVV